MDQPTAKQALVRLEPLLGEWRLKAGPPDGEPWPGEGRMSFEWHESGVHLVQRWRIDLAEAPDGVAIIGCDAANGTYFQLYSDNRGVCRVYEMSIDEREWKLWRQGPPFAQRFAGRFEDEGRTIVGRWELDEDGSGFKTDFDVTYRRID